MHYYNHNIGDYARDTSHLSVLEHGIYRLLLDWCYLNERAITTEQAIRIGRGNPTETMMVLSEFFCQSDDGWTHKRVEAEVSAYRQKAEKNRQNGKMGGRQKPKDNHHGSQTDAKHNPNQEPITNNQYTEGKPSVSAKRAAKKCPDSFEVSTDMIDWAAENAALVDMTAETAKFRDHTFSTARTDWPGTWRNWMRKAQEDAARRFQPQTIRASHAGQRQQPQSFAAKDREDGMRRWEQMTGRIHPDRLQQAHANVIDVQAAVTPNTPQLIAQGDSA